MSFGKQGEDSAARCMLHADFRFSGHFPKCTKQIKKGLPCRCCAKMCKGCCVTEGAACANPETCGEVCGGVITFCDVCRAECTNPTACGRYVHGQHCIQCEAFAEPGERTTCRPCQHRNEMVKIVMGKVLEKTAAAMPGVINEAAAVVGAAVPGEHLALDVFTKLTATMQGEVAEIQRMATLDNEAPDENALAASPLHRIPAALERDARSPGAHDPGHAELMTGQTLVPTTNLGKDLSTPAVIAIAAGIRQVALHTAHATSAAVELCKREMKEAGDMDGAPCNSSLVAGLDAPAAEGVQAHLLAWIRKDSFPRGFLARALLRDLLRQVCVCVCVCVCV